MIVKYQKNPPGYVALISVLIMSALLLVMATAISSASFFSRFNILDSEFKLRSHSLAEGCMNLVRFRLSKDTNYSTGENVNIGQDSCQIFSVQHNFPAAGQITVQTKATVKNAATNLEMVVDENLNLISWQELQNF